MIRMTILKGIAVGLCLCLTGCQTLQTAKVSSSAVSAERAKQVQLANKLRGERTARLARITARLQPEASDVCNSVKGNFNTSCRYPVKLRNDTSRNAHTDGTTVYVNSGIMAFTETDDELALVVGHEIAHNMLSHINKRIGSTILGVLVDVLIYGATGVDTGGAFSEAASKAYSKEYESEADYLGLYLTARAGYDISDAPNFWRRMGIENPGSIVAKYNSSHPSPPERYVALDVAVREIKIKSKDGLALIPNLIKDEHEIKQEEGVAAQKEEYALRDDVDEYGRQIAVVGLTKAEVKKEGQWAFEAERAARNTDCVDNRPVAVFKSISESKHRELYDMQCGDQVIVYECKWGSCSALK